MPVEQMVSRHWSTRSWRLLAAVIVVPLTLLGTFMVSSSAYAVTLNGSDAPGIQSVQQYSNWAFWNNVPTEYDVTPKPISATPTNIPNQVISSTTTWVQQTGTTSVWVPSQPGLDTTVTSPATTKRVYVRGHCTLWVPSTLSSGMSNSASSGPRMICEQRTPGHWVNETVPAQSVTVFGIGSGGYYQNSTYTYETPVTTTVTAEGIHITGAKLVSVTPWLLPVGRRSHMVNGGLGEIYGHQCSTPTTPLINPNDPRMAGYSLDPWNYSQLWSSLGVCNFEPNGGSNLSYEETFANWLSASELAQFDLKTTWQLTAAWNQVTTVNGAVTNSVPGSRTQTVIGPTFQGPTLPVMAMTAVPCPAENGVFHCPNGQTLPVN